MELGVQAIEYKEIALKTQNAEVAIELCNGII